MLQFALPFSAGFAATMVLHRMTTDNEILAAAVGGISYRRILLPIAGLGLVLMVVMVLLTQWVIPRFWGTMDRLITMDVTRLIQASINKGMPVEFGNVQIHADRLLVQHDPPETDAETRMVLFRVVAAELDRDGRIITEVAARQAVVDVHRREGQTYLMLALVDTVAYMGRTGQLLELPRSEPDAIAVPSAFKDRPMFLTQGQLLPLREHPDSYSRVVYAKTALAESLLQAEVRAHIADEIGSSGVIELSGGFGGLGQTRSNAAASSPTTGVSSRSWSTKANGPFGGSPRRWCSPDAPWDRVSRIPRSTSWSTTARSRICARGRRSTTGPS
jgi:hypothetical protein